MFEFRSLGFRGSGFRGLWFKVSGPGAVRNSFIIAGILGAIF